MRTFVLLSARAMGLSHFPPELLLIIFSFFTEEELVGVVSNVCKEWHRLVTEEFDVCLLNVVRGLQTACRRGDIGSVQRVLAWKGLSEEHNHWIRSDVFQASCESGSTELVDYVVQEFGIYNNVDMLCDKTALSVITGGTPVIKLFLQEVVPAVDRWDCALFIIPFLLRRNMHDALEHMDRYMGQMSTPNVIFLLNSVITGTCPIESVMWMLRHSLCVTFKWDIPSAINRAVRVGRLDIAQRFTEAYGVQSYDKTKTYFERDIIIALRRGDMPFARWLYDIAEKWFGEDKPYSATDQLYTAVADSCVGLSVCRGGIEMMEWVADKACWFERAVAADHHVALCILSARGNKEEFLWYYSRLVGNDRCLSTNDNEIAVLAIKNGSLEIASMLVDEYGFTFPHFMDQSGEGFLDACSSGHLDIIQWAFEKYPGQMQALKTNGPFSFKLFQNAVTSSMELAQFLHSKFDFSGYHFRTYFLHIVSSCECYLWLVDTFDMSEDDVSMNLARYIPNISLCDFKRLVIKYNIPWNSGILCTAFLSSRFDIAEWIISKFCVTKEEISEDNNFLLWRCVAVGDTDTASWLCRRFGISYSCKRIPSRHNAEVYARIDVCSDTRLWTLLHDKTAHEKSCCRKCCFSEKEYLA